MSEGGSSLNVITQNLPVYIYNLYTIFNIFKVGLYYLFLQFLYHGFKHETLIKSQNDPFYTRSILPLITLLVFIKMQKSTIYIKK